MYLICSGERGRMEKLNKAYNSAQHAVRNFSTLSPAADTNTASAGFPVERPRCHHLTCFSAELWGSFFRTEPWLCGGRETEQRSDRRQSRGAARRGVGSSLRRAAEKFLRGVSRLQLRPPHPGGRGRCVLGPSAEICWWKSAPSIRGSQVVNYSAWGWPWTSGGLEQEASFTGPLHCEQHYLFRKSHQSSALENAILDIFNDFLISKSMHSFVLQIV